MFIMKNKNVSQQSKENIFKRFLKKRRIFNFSYLRKPFHLRKHFDRIQIFEDGDIFKKINC